MDVSEVGGYRLVRELGRGGFGVVYLGESPHGQRAAVKLLHVGPSTDERFSEMFAREVDAARRVSPFCVAQVLDADPYAAQPWIATEYIEGPTLAQAIREHGPRVGADLHRLAVSTATALTAIHRAGVVHRDLKPGNILLAPDGPRVIDFGIARAFEDSASFTASAIVGTLTYMAPEQLEEGVRLTPALDIYSWGAVLVKAATGSDVFTADSQRAMMRKVMLEEPDCSEVAEPLQSLLRRCLAKEPEQRPTAPEILNTLLGGDEVADTETALRQGSAAAAHAISSASERPDDSVRGEGAPPRDDSSRGEERGARSQPGPTAADVAPIAFAGQNHVRLADLAEHMQQDWDAARRAFVDEQERGSLAAWIIEDVKDTRVERGLLRRPPQDPDVTVAEFVAQLRPDLPPVYRGQSFRLSALHELARAESLPEWSFSLATLRALARHYCAEPDHSCPPETPCRPYQQLVEHTAIAAEAAADQAGPLASWLDTAWPREMDSPPALVGPDAVATSWLVAALLAPEQWSARLAQLHSGLELPWRKASPSPPPLREPTPGDVGAAVVLAYFYPEVQTLGTAEQRLRTRRSELARYLEIFEKSPGASCALWGTIGGIGAVVSLVIALSGLFDLNFSQVGWGLAFAVGIPVVAGLTSAGMEAAKEGRLKSSRPHWLPRVEVEEDSIQARTKADYDQARAAVHQVAKSLYQLDRARSSLSSMLSSMHRRPVN
ncbi:serine/threonine-protein kinase [Lipingzhangella sp. LS1_29]|uniref:non-specific serine/threonine protein kinase n=1 Tax=Lipingzhangella rawalii TaxID=2055835 RepID=A0ABU2H628_9ACTN|nr:serine/threonine-protein kinase [Lipingzhangella rawalii]MDS1270745.1 serine/threonine-protein kinase [Lipingzhangella rawalii]